MRALILALILLIGSLPAMAQDRAAVERQFRAWLEDTVWPRARAAGVARATHEAAFNGVTLMWDLPDLVPPGSTAPAPGPQRQGEFGSPAAYFAPATLVATTRDGITMARRHATTLA
jgi:membrane-bound lytic murein transglycosylase B